MNEMLAIRGGPPVRRNLLPYGRQSIDAADIEAVVSVLESNWLTTGPAVESFERAFAEATGCEHAIAVSSGTAALHAAIFTLGIGPGDEVIVPAMTFAATANTVVYQGAVPVFADVEPGTLLLDPADVARRITPRTKAVVAVDYAGQPCGYGELRELTSQHRLHLLSDACHALGGQYGGRLVGTLADVTSFSLHPVKHITTGEGGMVTTGDPALAARARMFRSHGIDTSHREREVRGSWYYEMVELGYNYRLTDIQCALGESQLRRLQQWVTRRRAIAAQYDEAFAQLDAIGPLAVRPDVFHAYHLYVVRVEVAALSVDRGTLFSALRAEGIGVNVHYLPVHLHPFYRTRFGTVAGQCPIAEAAYEQILSLPMFPAMTDADVEDVIAAVTKVVRAFA